MAKVTGFLGVFEDKLDKLYHHIKLEYEKPREERNKENLKALAKEAKKLKKLVADTQGNDSAKCTCPSCGHKFRPKE